MSALRKIEAKLGTAIITYSAVLSFEYGKYPVGGKSSLTAGIGRLKYRYVIC